MPCGKRKTGSIKKTGTKVAKKAAKKAAKNATEETEECETED